MLNICNPTFFFFLMASVPEALGNLFTATRKVKFETHLPFCFVLFLPKVAQLVQLFNPKA